jgi:lipoate synthase
MAVIRKGRPENYDHSVHFLEDIRNKFSDYTAKGHLKVKLIDYVPSHIVTIIDDHKVDGVMFTTVYSFNQADPHRPSEIITYRKEKQFSFFLQEFNSLWDMGDDFIFNKKIDKK